MEQQLDDIRWRPFHSTRAERQKRTKTKSEKEKKNTHSHFNERVRYGVLLVVNSAAVASSNLADEKVGCGLAIALSAVQLAKQSTVVHFRIFRSFECSSVRALLVRWSPF
ncbi:hypothetical protein V9T40_006213 [Parthenolecanium corni]|uniref:Uncharacterized protein n=1 Tax=Parthenolecanium corni TaxID=536013 RepID=A0AAN9YBD5_9HEMI